jgi:hypothetical protein
LCRDVVRGFVLCVSGVGMGGVVEENDGSGDVQGADEELTNPGRVSEPDKAV